MSSATTRQTHCRTCGGMLDASLPGGGCPVCLWGGLISDDPAELAVDDLPEVDGYKIQREIGRGGMGVVYLAMQESPVREVALKIVAPYSLRAAGQRLRFLVEIEAMAAVTHPSLLPLYESGEDDDGRPWFTMQLAGGGTLAERLERYQGQWQMTAALLVRLGEAVQYSHERGILHRDLKPGNVLFDEQDYAYVADFGLAKWADQEVGMTHSTEMLGSPAYLAPETAAGGAKATTTASDIYGLGTILYELLTGSRLYEGGTPAQILSQILHQAPPPPRQRVPRIPRDLDIITLKAIARDPAKRYVSAAAMVEDLQLWLAGKAIKARPVSPWVHTLNWARRNPATATLALLLAASMVTGGLLLWRSNRQLTESLDDAEARVDFMTRELPLSLEPLGRLDLLDSVFRNVARHYQVSGRGDPESLSRQADFLTQWAQILRPRGQNLEAVERLTLAMEKARGASAGNQPPPAAIRSRITAGWRFGEALIQGKKYDEAEAILKETIAYAASHASEDLPLRILDAQLTLEMGWLAFSRNDTAQVKTAAMAALQKWQVLLPDLEQQPIPASHQVTLLEVIKTLDLLTLVAEQQQDTASAKRFGREFKSMAERLITLVPENAHFRSQLVIANQRSAQESGLAPDQILTFLNTAEEQASALMATDGGNARWMLAAVNSAELLASNAQKNRNDPEHRRWRTTMSQRLDMVYQMASTDYEFLSSRIQLSRACSQHHLPDDWPTARHHLLAQLEARRRAAVLTGNQSDFTWEMSEMAKVIEKYECREAAEQWRAGFQKTLSLTK